MDYVAKQHNGLYLGEDRSKGILKHKFICVDKHTFSLTKNRITNGAWCPFCSKLRMKQFLKEKNKANKKCPESWEEIQKTLDPFGLTAVKTNLPKTTQDFLTVTDQQGNSYSKRYNDILRFGAGKKDQYIKQKHQDFEEKIKRQCLEVGYEYIGITIPTSKGSVKYKYKGVEYTKQAIYFTKERHKADKRVSKTQKSISEYLVSLGFNPLVNHRIQLTKDEEEKYNWYYKHTETKSGTRSRYLELDIFIKEYNIAIEFHGARYHDAFRSKHHKYLPKFKYSVCKDKGIRLIQINQWEWGDKAKAILRNLLGRNENKVYARKCELKEVPLNEANEFYSKYHMKGPRKNIKVSYGLYYENNLVMVCSLSIIENKLHLSRLCSLPNTTVVGGLGRLTNRIKKYRKIFTLIDLMWYNGDSWLKVGWNIYETQNISYVYLKENENIPTNKENFRKLSVEVKERYAKESCVEYSYAKDMGYHQLWDCGKLKLSLDI